MAEFNFTTLASEEAYPSLNDNCSDKGLLLPLLEESNWAVPVRAFLYLSGLLYCFMGVAIIADVFMCAIEKITSQTRKIVLSSSTNDDEPDVVEVKIWNDTVANLTLMALGSSAPEILLSIIEVCGNGFESGELGPGTIVGSAAFNLLIITAVCILAIPNGGTTRIKYIKVFSTTAFFSVFAYIWLLIILMWITPNQVDLWEAVLTFIMFPICVILAYLADRDFCSAKVKRKDKQLELGFAPGGFGNNKVFAVGSYPDGRAPEKDLVKDGKLNKQALIDFMREVRKYPGLTDTDAAVLAANKLVDQQRHSRMWYRIGAIRDYTGGRRTRPTMSAKLQETLESSDHPDETVVYLDPITANRVWLRRVYSTLEEHGEPIDGSARNTLPRAITPSVRLKHSIVEFHAATCCIVENVGKFPVTVKRHGITNTAVTVRVESIDGTATEGEDYVKVDEVLKFQPEEVEKEIMVEIVNDSQWEPDEVFFLKLSIPGNSQGVVLGRVGIMEITILNDDEPGIIQFKKRGLLVTESCGNAVIPVERIKGSDGEVTVKWRTVDKTAFSGRDFVGGQGQITFKHTEVEIHLEIPIVNDMDVEKDEHFEVELFDPSGGAQLGSVTKTMITITNDDDFNSVVDRVMMMTNANVDAIKVHTEDWASQFRDALNVNGGDVDNATTIDYIMHFITFGWKVIFACVPPPGIWGGWLCFIFSLIAIGILTAIIGDLAGIFGCLIGIPDSITAITLVAAGTSLPDLFASRTAAFNEKHADNAIGNVTGSNSVNVFLGLGLPWLIASIYWFTQGKPFVVHAGSLGFSVAVYTVISVISIAILMARRWLPVFGRGELGGPRPGRIATSSVLFLLWSFYILLSCLQALDYIRI
ncbi:hypothetical protein CHUAL_011915 [Chamberlinius hualienensis]